MIETMPPLADLDNPVRHDDPFHPYDDYTVPEALDDIWAWFDSSGLSTEPDVGDSEPEEPRPSLDSSEFAAWRRRLTSASLPTDHAALVSLLREMEDLKSLLAAAQARSAVAFDHVRRQDQADQGIPPSRRGIGVGAEVALARRESPHRGGRLLGLAKALVSELPVTLQALAAGTINEWRATIIARETACLDPADRRSADAWLGHHLMDHPTLGDRQLIADVRRKVIELDQHAVLRRRRNAAGERRVSLRPLPDGMVQLSAILPLEQGIAVYATLKNAANTCSTEDHGDIATDEPKHRRAARPGLGARMADSLVELVTGRSSRAACNIELIVVMTDQALLGYSEEPAHINGYGPMPADWVRDLITRTTDPERQIALRRLFRGKGRTITLETGRRLFTPGLKKLIAIRDQHCRTPWCNAPIRHHDHVKAKTWGGATSDLNGQGLCEACNYTKQQPGWKASAHHDPKRGHVVTLTTPTGHTYESAQPAGPAN